MADYAMASTTYTSDTVSGVATALQGIGETTALQGVAAPQDLVSTLFTGTAEKNVKTDVFTITFSAKPGYYYSKKPTPNSNFKGMENYNIVENIDVKDNNGHVIGKTFTIKHTGDEVDVFDINNSNIFFTHKTSKILVKKPSKPWKIHSLNVGKAYISSNGEIVPIKITGTPNTPFTLTIEDKNGKNMLTSQSIVKFLKSTTTDLDDGVAAYDSVANTSSVIMDVGTTVNLKVGMSIKGVGLDSDVTIISINTDSQITISSAQTVSADTALTFREPGELKNVTIPTSGIYHLDHNFYALKSYVKTLSGAASSATTLNVGNTDSLEVGMRMTGTGVDGNIVKILSVLDDSQVIVSESQTINDATDLTFTEAINKYDVTVTADLGKVEFNSGVLSLTNSIEQHIDTVIAFVPSTALSGVTVSGTVTYTSNINYNRSKLVTISMIATSSSGGLELDRQPRVSTVDSTLSDFSNINSITKTIEAHSGQDSEVVVLNNTTGLVAGMSVTGRDIVSPFISTSKTGADYVNDDCEKAMTTIHEDVTIDTVNNDFTITLSSPQTLACDPIKPSLLMFNNGGTSISISGLKAVLSNVANTGEDNGIIDGVCTVTGTAIISNVGGNSFTSTLSFDNFLSKA